VDEEAIARSGLQRESEYKTHKYTVGRKQRVLMLIMVVYTVMLGL
jgi:hypothetical protein